MTQAPDAPVPSPEGMQSARGLVFVCDASAEAERLMVALRARGYPTLDVPLGLLPARMRYETPDLVVLDADAHEAETRATQIAENSSIALVLVGHADGLLERRADLRARARLVLFRPLAIEEAANAIAAHLGPVPRGPRPAALRASRAPILVASARRPFRSDGTASSHPPPHTDYETDWPVHELRSVGPIVGESIPPGPLRTSSAPASQPKSERGAGLSAETRTLLDQARRKVSSQALQPSRPTRLGPLEGREGSIASEFVDALRTPLESGFEPPERFADSKTHDGETSTGNERGPRRTDAPSLEPPSPSLLPLEVDYQGSDQATNPGGRQNAPDSAEAPGALIEDLSDLLERPTAAPPMRSSPGNLDFGRRDDRIPSLDTSPPLSPSKGDALELPLVSAPLPPARPNEGPVPLATTSPTNALPFLGAFVGARRTGSLAQEVPTGIRRILVKDGDFVTVTSSSESESLVAFLELRGDLSAEAVLPLGAIPRFGRHAGAALVARGLLRQDDLWPALRAHAEWLLAQILVVDAPLHLEADIPGRLLEEPAVFGGSAGAEIYVDAVRRVMTPNVAFERLGRGARTITVGDNEGLLAECGLSATLERDVRHALGEPLERYLERSPHLLPLLAALVELGVFTVGGGQRPEPSLAASIDERDQAMDVESFATRVANRRALSLDGDYFSVLGVSPAATAYEIERAHEKLRSEFDPARLSANLLSLRDDVALILEVLDEALYVLGDEVRRRRYRRALAAEAPKS